MSDCQCREYDQLTYPNCPVHGTAAVTAEKIIRDITAWQQKNCVPFPGHVVVSVHDARQWDENHWRNIVPGFKSNIKAGDRGTVWGVDCAVVNIPAGQYVLEPETNV